MLACEKRFERYLLDTPQKFVIGKEPNLHQHANLTFELKVIMQIRLNESVQSELTCIFCGNLHKCCNFHLRSCQNFDLQI